MQVILLSIGLIKVSVYTPVCGSASVAEATRKALGFSLAGPAQIMKGGASVMLHVESFGYA
jgi:ferric-chelate reductase